MLREKAEALGGLPRFLLREVYRQRRCGLLEFGLVMVKCATCGKASDVPFSCKSRLCPSRSARRAHETAVHLVRRHPSRRLDWASFHRHTFGVDVLRCPCGGRRRIIAVHSTHKAAEGSRSRMNSAMPRSVRSLSMARDTSPEKGGQNG